MLGGEWGQPSSQSRASEDQGTASAEFYMGRDVISYNRFAVLVRAVRGGPLGLPGVLGRRVQWYSAVTASIFQERCDGFRLKPSGSGIGKPQPTSCCLFLQIKFYWHIAMPAGLLNRPWLSCVKTETGWVTEPKLFITPPFKRITPDS